MPSVKIDHIVRYVAGAQADYTAARAFEDIGFKWGKRGAEGGWRAARDEMWKVKID